MTRRGRGWDIIVYGATGFTGALVAEYLCKNYGVNETIRWAIAGRSLAKLERVREELSARHPEAAQLTLLEADSADPISLERLAECAEVICTTVGQYLLYGAPLVAACVKHQTDYCDLTGETPFIRQMIDAHHDRALRDGVKIVHACGYDSIPSDLGVLLAQRAFRARYGRWASEVRAVIGATRGGFSGGTIASMIGVLDQARDTKQRRVIGNPYGLNPKDGVRGLDGSDLGRALFDEEAGRWLAPFVMAAINTRVVRRSHALRGYPYGQSFRYQEAMGFKQGFKGMISAQVTALGLGTLVMLLMLRPTRALLQKTILPRPGQGPDREARTRGYFTTRLLAIDGADLCWVRVGDSLDPGYGSTSKMLAETAVMLACHRDALPASSGVLTPAVALGEPLIERLSEAGMIWEVEDAH